MAKSRMFLSLSNQLHGMFGLDPWHGVDDIKTAC